MYTKGNSEDVHMSQTLDVQRIVLVSVYRGMARRIRYTIRTKHKRHVHTKRTFAFRNQTIENIQPGVNLY